MRCGTTGVVTFLRGRTLYVAWLGDSQVILVRKGQVVELMKPHKPDREVTLTCMTRVGGRVVYVLYKLEYLFGCPWKFNQTTERDKGSSGQQSKRTEL